LHKKDKRFANHLLTALVIVCFLVLVFLLWLLNDMTFMIIGIVVLAMLLFAWLFVEYRFRGNKSITVHNQPPEVVTSFALLSLDGEREQEWYAQGVNAFLIGKGSANRDVDIELGDTHHSEYISSEHAVLNFSLGYWYIEDLDSKHGVGVKKKGAEYTFRLKPSVPYKIEIGDTIFISKVKILVL